MSEPKSKELLNQLGAGESDAATAIFDRYVERLLALARARISPKLRRRIDPDDVVQSAYRSFFVHARGHEYQLTRSGDLWRLLAGTVLNKLQGQIEKQTAAKRSIHREGSQDADLINLRSHEPTVAEVVAVGEQLRLIIDGLLPDERAVLILTLQGQSTDEISKEIRKSERTVRRLLAQARQRFEKHLLEDGAGRESMHPPRRPPMAEPLAPLVFSDYVLEQLLGSGGMGKVYRARDMRSGKTVAIKALHKSRQHDERAVAQFVQESTILARLSHPNIVGVEGLGRFPAGGYFIVMEFVAGTDLQTRLSSGPCRTSEAVSVMRKVCSAVQYAHERGIVHCDLKPGNVLVDANDHVLVTDFGFAFILADRSPAQLDAIGGTAGYVAPEVLNLESPPTRAADVFALGAMLWTLIAGRVPLTANDVQSARHDTKPIEAICRRCLARNPADRFSSASDLMSALDALPIA